MNLISRYLFREVFVSTLLVVAVLFVILMSNQFAEILGDAAANELPKDAVFAVFGLTSLRYLTFIMPVAVFLGIMLALARLNRDAESAAMFACGIGPANILIPISVLTAIIAGGASWLTLISAPEAVRRIEQIKFDAEARLEFDVLEAGRFIATDSGATVFYADRVEGEMIYDVFWTRETTDRVVVVLAERGQRILDPFTGMLTFVLYDGTRYEGQPGSLEFSVFEFAEHGIPIRESGRRVFTETIEMRSSADLLGTTDPVAAAELHWRISTPMSLLILSVLAVPLSRSSPREGRFARIGVGLLIYLIYANLLSIARVWVERGDVSIALGMWWAHLAIALFALYLFGRDAGWFARAPLRVKQGTA